MSRDAVVGIEDVGPLSTLEDPLRRRLYEFVSEQHEPVSRDQAAAAAGIGRTLAAYHLDKLEEAGLLTTHHERPAGRGGPGAGRPAKLYTRAVREFSVTLPPRDYELLAGLVLEAAEQDDSGAVRAAVGQAAERTGRELAARVLAAQQPGDAATSTLLSALRSSGYEPATGPDGDIELRNCPFHHAAQQHTDLVCGLNLRLVRGLLDAAGALPARAALQPQPGHCCVVIHAGQSV